MDIYGSTKNEQKANSNSKDKGAQMAQITSIIKENHLPGQAEKEYSAAGNAGSGLAPEFLRPEGLRGLAGLLQTDPVRGYR